MELKKRLNGIKKKKNFKKGAKMKNLVLKRILLKYS